MEIFDTANIVLSELDNDTSYWLYNGLDAAVTLDIFDNLHPMTDASTRGTYEFSKALQAPVLEMNLRGLAVNQRRKAKVVREMKAKVAQLEAQLDRIITEGVGATACNWRSPAQLKALLYDIMGLPVQRKRTAAGLFAPTTDEAALEKLSMYYIAEPICNHLLTLRSLGKSLGFLQTNIDRDGRMRTQFNIAGTDTGRFASSVTDYGTGCVKPSAQALTLKGWKAIGELTDGDLIAQVNEGSIEFVPATFHWQDFSGELWNVNTEQVNLTMTPGHRVLCRDYRDNEKVYHAGRVASLSRVLLPLSGINQSGTLEIPRYVAMLLADFSKESTQWRGAFKKTRKQERFEYLAEKFNLNWSEQKAREGYKRYAVKGELDWPTKWGPWVLQLDRLSAINLLDEAKYWDAHIRGDSYWFFTVDKEQAEWFQTLCHIAGRSSTITSKRNSDEAYGNNSIIYTVNVKPRSYAQVMKKHWHKELYVGKVGCPQVPSSFWLVRENGFISVTGNTNLQNVTGALRSMFVADPGMKFCNLDLEQGDSRNVGAIAWNTLVEEHGEGFAGSYLDACESSDLHTLVCRMGNPSLLWGTEPDRQLADRPAHKHLTYRDLAKKLGHGSNYLGQPPTMAKHARIPVGFAKTFQQNYFAAFPCIPAWHQSVFWNLENLGYLETLFGDRRFFFDRPREDATKRKAVAHCPQSMTAKEINTAILNLWRADRVQLLVQVHDSILFQYPEEMENEIVPWALETAKVHLELKKGRDFTVPTEAQVGWNWGYKGPDNPDGLTKWKGGDTRRREETQFKLSLMDF